MSEKKRLGRRYWAGIVFTVLVTAAFYITSFCKVFNFEVFQFYCLMLSAAVVIIVPSLTLTDLLPKYWQDKNGKINNLSK